MPISAVVAQLLGGPPLNAFCLDVRPAPQEESRTW